MQLTKNNPEPAQNQRPIEWVLCKAPIRPFPNKKESPLFPERGIVMFGLALIASCTMQACQLSLDFNVTKEHVPTSELYGFLTPVRDLSGNQQSEVLSDQSEPGALPPTLEELAKKYRPLIDRVLTRLSEAERKEVNSHLQQDIRQAWITVSYAQRMSDAFVQASYAIYGKHPDQIWPAIIAERKAKLGTEYYDWYDSADMPRPDVPRIHHQSSAGVSPEGGSASEYSGGSATGLCSIPITPLRTTDGNRPKERGITADVPRIPPTSSAAAYVGGRAAAGAGALPIADPAPDTPDDRKETA